MDLEIVSVEFFCFGTRRSTRLPWKAGSAEWGDGSSPQFMFMWSLGLGPYLDTGCVQVG